MKKFVYNNQYLILAFAFALGVGISLVALIQNVSQLEVTVSYKAEVIDK